MMKFLIIPFLFICLASQGQDTVKVKVTLPTTTIKAAVSATVVRQIKADLIKALNDSLKGQKSVEIITGERLTGTADGKNKVFRLSGKPILNSEAIYVNGLRMRRKVNAEDKDGDYSISATGIVTFAVAPPWAKAVIADYLKQ